MTVYVDPLMTYPGKGDWCHLAVGSDDDVAELHEFATRIGLKRSWFQPHHLVAHYDLRPSKRTLVLKRGAVALDSTVAMLRLCRRVTDERSET